MSITIQKKEKETSIRVKERTKKMLEATALGKETYDEIVQRLVKLSLQLSTESRTKILERGNVTGTSYEKVNKQFHITINHQQYSTVCTYNDLTIIAMLRKDMLKGQRKVPEWEVDLEIVNIMQGESWRPPSEIASDTVDLLYFACLKEVLEEAFDTSIYEIITERDFLDKNKWEQTYERNQFSIDSLEFDVKRHFRKYL